MIRILTQEQLRTLDRRSSEEFGIAGLVLMENAGIRVVEALRERVGGLGEAGVVVLCGKGNNGGDGFVIARQLLACGCLPSTFLFADPDEVGGDARVNLDILTRLGHAPTPVRDTASWMREARAAGPVDIVIDALLGTGLARPVGGLLAEVIDSLDETFPDATIVSVDVPSGCFADRSDVPGPAVEADLTVTFSALKACLVFPPATVHAGDIVVTDIGNPHELLDSTGHRTGLLSPESFPGAFAPRAEDTHKGDFGRILVIGGSVGMPGAPAMTGEAALRSGAGLVSVASAASAVDVIAGHMPELMTRRLPETHAGSIALAALEDPYLVDLVATASVVALGPGLGRDPETAEFVRKLVAGARVPIILDADGIDAFTGAADMLPERSQPIVLTPHPGEMAGLVGSDAGTLVSSRLEVAREFAAARGVAIVLKGFRTVIAMPDGWAFVNPTGNPGMATAGSGDVLTGMIAALVGQPHLGTFRERVCLAVYLHGLAGDLAVETLGEECLTARDLIAFLPRAWAALRSGPDD